ncbi:hypothetical protein [Oligoflexus tunisiensis]|uniref:hypothetical protein n=1 Tax=Oligoflexus tunisiensis TaxID=708132 RepID=UPI00114CABDA|nr:hypothetical protein [Oligoflexus tunisiensis]
MTSRIQTLSFVTLLVTASLSCDKKEDDDAAATSTPDVATATTNIDFVSDNMVPGSLILSTSLNLEGNPCEGTDGFFDCQPQLLKLYLGMGKSMVEMSSTMITQITETFGSFPDEKGTLEGDDGTTVDYEITSDTVFKFLIHSTKGPFMHLDVADNVYKIKFDGANSDEEEGEGDGGGPASVETTITYTDENNFEVDLFLDGMECSGNDVQAPASIAINIKYVEGVAQGKAMMYLPRWLGNNTCETTPTAETKMFIYTDFAGDSTNTTGALYMVKNTISDVSAFSDWEVADFCTNFSSQCQNGAAFGEQTPIADRYKNNFCVTTDDVEWATTCTSSSTLISTPTFSAASTWILPTDLEARDVTLPSAL